MFGVDDRRRPAAVDRSSVVALAHVPAGPERRRRPSHVAEGPRRPVSAPRHSVELAVRVEQIIVVRVLVDVLARLYSERVEPVVQLTQNSGAVRKEANGATTVAFVCRAALWSELQTEIDTRRLGGMLPKKMFKILFDMEQFRDTCRARKGSKVK